MKKPAQILILSWLLLFFSDPAFSGAADSLFAHQFTPESIVWYSDGTVQNLPLHIADNPENNFQYLRLHIAKEFARDGYFLAEIDSLVKKEEVLNVYTRRGCRFQIGEINRKSEDEDIVPFTSFVSAGDFYSDANVEMEIGQILSAYERAGYPLVQVSPEIIKSDGQDCFVQLKLNISPGQQMYVHDVVFDGIEKTNPDYLKIASGLRDSVLVTPAELASIHRNIENTNYFSFVSEPDIISTVDGYALFFRAEERSLNSFDAILGYVPQPNQGNIVVGTADLLVRNVGWQGSTLGISFERLQQFTTKFNLMYEKDWVNSWPLGIGGSFDFVQQDTTYQIRNLRLQSSYYLTSSTRIRLGLRSEGISANQNPNVPVLVLNGTARLAGVGLQFNNTDRRISPQRGTRASIFFETGIKQTTDSRAEEFGVQRNMAQQEINVDLRQFFSPFNRQVIAFRMNGFIMESAQFTESDLTRFGGARSFRGYREDQFRASRLMWGDAEYRYLLDPVSYAFVFGAAGGYRRPALITEPETSRTTNRFLYSYGFGFSYNTPIGFVKFTYALSEEDVISNGKIHFGIISEF